MRRWCVCVRFRKSSEPFYAESSVYFLIFADVSPSFFARGRSRFIPHGITKSPLYQRPPSGIPEKGARLKAPRFLIDPIPTFLVARPYLLYVPTFGIPFRTPCVSFFKIDSLFAIVELRFTDFILRSKAPN